MRKLSAVEAKDIQLNILKVFRQICDSENLSYSLYAGTLIGALRHSGFIPWDDDIDVAMPREDYEKLYRVFSQCKHPDYIRLYDSRNDPLYNLPFMKLADTRTFQQFPGNEPTWTRMGLHIDVFAIDGLPKCRLMALMYLKILRFFRHVDVVSCLSIGVKSRSHIKRLVVLVFKLITLGAPPSFWHRIHNWLASRFSLKKSLWGGNSVWGYAEKELVPVECYKGRISVRFEGECYDAFSGADEYLRAVYGDYMQLPPMEARVGNHIVASFIEE